MKYVTKKAMLMILKDAERDFRLKPEEKPGEKPRISSGLCLYIEMHPLLWNSDLHVVSNYSAAILQDRQQAWYTFCDKRSQETVWEYPQYAHMRYERANWCKKRIKEIEKEMEK